jgi:hypothetical protein
VTTTSATKAVFFSWQSDLWESRAVIRGALEKAVKKLNREGSLEEALRTDEATKDVAGWPDITATIFEKIKKRTVFVADITPVNGPDAGEGRLTPNPNVMLELGYALATGHGRTRIVCVVNEHYLPDGNLSLLPFDIRGSRPLVFSLRAPEARAAEKGVEDEQRTAARRGLAGNLERAIGAVLDAVDREEASRILRIRPHLATDGKQFQVVMELQSAVPFQIDCLINEPSGNVLSSIMMAPSPVDPKGERVVRFRAEELKPLKPPNDIYILSGRVGHLSTAMNRVPQLYPFEVRYRRVADRLEELSRKDVPPH